VDPDGLAGTGLPGQVGGARLGRQVEVADGADQPGRRGGGDVAAVSSPANTWYRAESAVTNVPSGLRSMTSSALASDRTQPAQLGPAEPDEPHPRRDLLDAATTARANSMPSSGPTSRSATVRRGRSGDTSSLPGNSRYNALSSNYICTTVKIYLVPYRES
jgi:hypothetical protein